MRGVHVVFWNDQKWMHKSSFLILKIQAFQRKRKPSYNQFSKMGMVCKELNYGLTQKSLGKGNMIITSECQERN